MSAIPDLIGEQEAGPFWPAEVNRRHRERMAEVIAERDDAREQLSSICLELFDNDDTIGGESAAEYVIRQVTKERERLEFARAANRDVERIAREREELRETLRDRFAMAALSGIVQAVTTAEIHHSAQTPPEAIVAGWAYGYADAMMKTREGGAA